MKTAEEWVNDICYERRTVIENDYIVKSRDAIAAITAARAEVVEEYTIRLLYENRRNAAKRLRDWWSARQEEGKHGKCPVSRLVELVKELYSQYNCDTPATVPTINAAASLIALAPWLAEMVEEAYNHGCALHELNRRLDTKAAAALKEIDDG